MIVFIRIRAFVWHTHRWFFFAISNKIRWFSFPFFHFAIFVRCALGLVVKLSFHDGLSFFSHAFFYYYFGCFSTCTIYREAFCCWAVLIFSIFRISISLLFSTDSCIIPGTQTMHAFIAHTRFFSLMRCDGFDKRRNWWIIDTIENPFQLKTEIRDKCCTDPTRREFNSSILYASCVNSIVLHRLSPSGYTLERDITCTRMDSIQKLRNKKVKRNQHSSLCVYRCATVFFWVPTTICVLYDISPQQYTQRIRYRSWLGAYSV